MKSIVKSQFDGPSFFYWVGRVFAAIGISIALVGTVGAQTGPSWNSLGPAGGAISALLASPTAPATLYAGTPENGVFVSNDAGATWSAANAGLVATSLMGRQTLTPIYALATDGQFIYAATATGLFYTAGTGTPNWLALAPTGSTTPIGLLVFEPQTRRLIAASTQTDGVTTPGIYVATIAATGSPAPVWTFTAVPSSAGTTIAAISLVPAQGALTPATLLVGSGNSLFTASVASGSGALNWVNGDPSGTLGTSPVSAVVYSTEFVQAYACSGGAVFYSGNPLDAQALWSPATFASSSPFALNCNAFISIPPAVGGAPQLLLGTDQGAFVSTDGTTFQATGTLGVSGSANAFAISTPTAPAAAPAGLFVGTGFGVVNTGVAAATQGATWSASNGPASVAAGGTNQRLNNANTIDSAVVGGALFAAAMEGTYTEVFASVDGGAHWSATGIASKLNVGEAINMLAGDSANSVLYAATSQGLLAYSPTSSRWSVVAGGTLNASIWAVNVGTSALFIGTDTGLYALPLSGNPTGAVPVAAGLSAFRVRSLLVSGGDVYAGTIDASDANTVFTAPETAAAAGTAVWGAFGTTSTGINSITSLLRVGDQLLAATRGGLVWTASAGTAWVSANTSANASQQISDPFGIVNSLYSDGVSIYAATGSNGIFVSPVGAAYSWAAFNGNGTSALPSFEVHTLRGIGSTLYAATRAGVASFNGLGSGGASTGGGGVVPPQPVIVTSSGGGAIDEWFVLLILGALVGLRTRRR